MDTLYIHRLSLCLLLQELKRSNKQLVTMENERTHLEPKLRRAEQLQGEVDSLSRELQVLGELYQQQREEAQELMRHSQREQELRVLCASLLKEKEASEKVIASLSQQLQVNRARGEELERAVSRGEEEVASLQRKLVSAQGKYQAKMTVGRLSIVSLFYSSIVSMWLIYVYTYMYVGRYMYLHECGHVF